MSDPATPLGETLHNPATPQARTEIIHHLWRGRPSRLNNLDWDAYFAYYTRECNEAMIDEGKYLTARTHQDMLRIAHLLEDEPTKDNVRQKIRQTLTQQRPPEDENRMLDGSIKLAARLLAMVNIGSLPSEVSGRLFLPWNEGSLRNSVHSHFDVPQEVDPKNVVIGTDLTARNIDHISEIEIVSTDNLVDHLRLVERDKKLCIFHHVSFLKWMESTQKYVVSFSYNE